MVKAVGMHFHIKFYLHQLKPLIHMSCATSLVISVGTHTFKHEDGNNNFVQRNEPLGWHIGSDSRERKVGINWFYKNKVLTSINMGKGILVKIIYQ